MIVQSPTIQPHVGKRKSISRDMDLGSLSSRRHLKVRTDKAPSKTPSSKASKSKDATAYLDDQAVNLVLSVVQTEALTPFVGRPHRKTHPSTLVEAPPTLVLDEGHAFSLLNFFFFLRENF